MSYPLDPNAVIAAAFRAAGLPVREVPTAPLGATPRYTRPDHRGGLEGRGTDAELVRHSARDSHGLIDRLRLSVAVYLSACHHGTASW